MNSNVALLWQLSGRSLTWWLFHIMTPLLPHLNEFTEVLRQSISTLSAGWCWVVVETKKSSKESDWELARPGQTLALEMFALCVFAFRDKIVIYFLFILIWTFFKKERIKQPIIPLILFCSGFKILFINWEGFYVVGFELCWFRKM